MFGTYIFLWYKNEPSQGYPGTLRSCGFVFNMVSWLWEERSFGECEKNYFKCRCDNAIIKQNLRAYSLSLGYNRNFFLAFITTWNMTVPMLL